jgi:hypothetical protein
MLLAALYAQSVFGGCNMKLRVVILAYAYLLVPLGGSAQTLATIVGTVTDASGAVVPGAQITVVSGETGFVRKLVSNQDGNYTAARIPLGNYVVTAVASGFQRLTRTGIVLNAGQTLRVDLRLTVGSTQQQVTVQGNVSQVQTDTAEISNTVTGEQIHELNIPAENFANFALLTPGAAPLAGGFQPSVIEDIATDTLPVNGVPGNMNNWEIDGTNDVDQGSGSDSLQIFPSLDAIAEFHIVTGDYSAEYAKSGSAMIEIATKSGTDKFHGSAFEFLQNDALDSNDWFLNRTIAPPGGNAPKQALKNNNFGFTLGGPFYIPGHYNTSKQKTFFFISEEWREERAGVVLNANVPSTRERLGDFSQCDPTSGDYNPVVASGCQLPVNPATGTNFPGDVVPVSPTANTLLNSLVPLPNNGIIGYTVAPDLPTSFREDDIRVDQNISDKTRLFVRYTDDAYNQTYIPSLWTSAQFGTVKTLMNIPSKNAVLNITKTFSPTLMNEFIAGYSSDSWHVNSSLGIGSVSGSILKPADFAAQTIFPKGASGPFLPAIDVSGGGPSFDEDTGYPYWYWNGSPSLKDDLGWIRGKHSLKFGGYFLLNRFNEIDPNGGYDSQGVLTFSSSSAVTTGNALADMYLGRIGSYSEVGHVINGQLVGGYAAGDLWAEEFEPYFEDDWRATHRLTLNFGFRYYYVTPWKDYSNPPTTSIFVPSQYNPADQAQLDAAGNLVPGTGDNWLNYGNGLDKCGSKSIPKGCIFLNHATPSPRFGFAWDPNGSGKTAIRGGYALTWDTSNAHMTASGRYGTAPVIGNLSAYNIVGYQNIVPGALPPVALMSLPLHQGLPQIQEFSLGVQHQFSGNNLLSVSYVGTLGRFLEQAINVNQIPVGVGVESAPELAGIPGCDAAGNCNVQSVLIHTEEPAAFFAPYRGYTTIEQMQATGNSNYNSLQVNFRHNVGHGLMFQTVYTWSHTLDDILGGGGTSTFSNGVNDYDLNRWYGTSALNQAQVLQMNYIYRLPFFAHAGQPFVRTALGGWQISGVTTFETGPPITLNCGISGMASGIGGNVLCNSLGTVGVDKGITNDPQFGPTPTWFNPATIGQITVPQLAANNEPGMFGYMGKYPITGPGRNDWDLALLKNFSLPWLNGETSNLQLRLETFNTFNHPQWSTVNLFCSGLTAPGQPCDGANNIGNGEVTGDYGPRTLELALHFTF